MTRIERTIALLLVLLGSQALLGQEWRARTKAAVDEHDLPKAFNIINEYVAANPNDWDAAGYRARILGWQGKWAESEAEYRRVLEHAAADTDLLLGLADVLAWQGKSAEIFPVLERAEAAGAPANEILKRRARAYAVAGNDDEAKRTYRELLKADPGNAEARGALTASSETGRFELRFGNDTDIFNYTNAANAQTVSLLARWNRRWSTSFVGNTFQRFGEQGAKFGSAVSYKLGKHDYVAVGGAASNPQDVVSRYDQSVEYGHGFSLRAGWVKGLETSVEERALWFTGSQVTLVRGTALVYLPREWMWSVTATGARSAFDMAGSSWSPGGATRLMFPIVSRLQGNVMYAVGSENYAVVDQIGQFSAHTYGGGIRWKLNSRQDVSAYAAFQNRTQGRTQMSTGVSYGFRF